MLESIQKKEETKCIVFQLENSLIIYSRNAKIKVCILIQILCNFLRGNKMIYIGNHVSMSKGFLAMGKEEFSLGGTTFAFFTRNPRGGNAKEFDMQDIEALNQFLKEHDFGKLVAHAPYTMNLCSAKEEVRNYSKEMFAIDLMLMEKMPGNYLNFHPGSELGQGYDIAKKQIVDALNDIMFEDQTITILLETMAGKGSEVGRTFEELKGIIDDVKVKEKIGVCLDTCHVHDGGYDIVDNLDGVLSEFDRIIGLDKLKAIHLNDSKNVKGAHKDRHEKLGLGYLGNEALIRIIQHPNLQGLPFILETPNDNDGYRKEITFVKENMI